MRDYTPTTDEVKGNYMSGAWLKGDRNPDQFNPAVYRPVYFAEFDRWLAEVERAAAEKAWWAAESAFGQAHDQDHLDPWSHMPVNPYRAAALGLTAGQEGESSES